VRSLSWVISINILLVSTPAIIAAHSQTVPTVQQKAGNSLCSNVVALTGSVNLNCSALTPEQKRILGSIPAILNKILANQIDSKAVMDKLDEILKAEAGTSPIVSAPHGIAIAGGGTVTNPTVNNFGPPPPNFSVSDNCLNDAATLPVSSGDYNCLVTIHTDMELDGNIAFKLIFDGTIEQFAVSTSSGPVTAFVIPAPNNTAKFSIGSPSSLPANGEIYVTVLAKKPVRFIAWQRGYEDTRPQ